MKKYLHNVYSGSIFKLLPQKFGGEHENYRQMSDLYENAPTAAEGLEAVKRYVRGLESTKPKED